MEFMFNKMSQTHRRDKKQTKFKNQCHLKNYILNGAVSVSCLYEWINGGDIYFQIGRLCVRIDKTISQDYMIG